MRHICSYSCKGLNILSHPCNLIEYEVHFVHITVRVLTFCPTLAILLYTMLKICCIGLHAIPVPYGPDSSVLQFPYPLPFKLISTTWTDSGRDGLGLFKTIRVRPSRPYRRLDSNLMTSLHPKNLIIAQVLSCLRCCLVTLPVCDSPQEAQHFPNLSSTLPFQTSRIKIVFMNWPRLH